MPFFISGYYLYMESSYPRVPNDVARLFSPVYVHNVNAPYACFEFSYHMYGKAVGSLRLYMKERGQVLKELSPKWELIGDQGDQWTTVQIHLEPSNENNSLPFQIVFEGQLGYGHQGDVAIDDLKMTLGQKCSKLDDVEEELNEVKVSS